MANYTISKILETQTIGSSVNDALPNVEDRSLFIKPNPGYVVSSTSFSLPIELPSGISSIELSDTSLPGELGNEVMVVVTFTPNYILTSDNSEFKLNLVGDADLYSKPIVGDKSVLDVYFEISETLNNSSWGYYLVYPGFTYENNIITGSVKTRVPTPVARIYLTADDGYYYLKKPSLKSVSSHITSKTVQVGKDYLGRINTYIVDIFYTNELDSLIGDRLTFNIDSTPEASLPFVKEISNLTFKQSTINPNGGRKQFRLTGTVRSEWSLSIVRNSDSQSIYSASGMMVLQKVGEAYSNEFRINGESGTGYVIDVDFPELTQTNPNGDDLSEFYTVTLSGNNGTEINSNISTTTISQYPIPKVAITSGLSGSGTQFEDLFMQGQLPSTTCSADIIIEGRSDKTSKDLSAIGSLKPSRRVELTFTTTATALTLNPSYPPEHTVITKYGSRTLGGDIVFEDDIGMSYFKSGKTRLHYHNPEDNNYDPAYPYQILSIDIPNKTIDPGSVAGHSYIPDEVDRGLFTLVNSSFCAPGKTHIFVPNDRGGTAWGWDYSISKITTEQVSTKVVKVGFNISVNRFGNVYEYPYSLNTNPSWGSGSGWPLVGISLANYSHFPFMNETA